MQAAHRGKTSPSSAAQLPVDAALNARSLAQPYSVDLFCDVRGQRPRLRPAGAEGTGASPIPPCIILPFPPGRKAFAGHFRQKIAARFVYHGRLRRAVLFCGPPAAALLSALPPFLPSPICEPYCGPPAAAPLSVTGRLRTLCQLLLRLADFCGAHDMRLQKPERCATHSSLPRPQDAVAVRAPAGEPSVSPWVKVR